MSKFRGLLSRFRDKDEYWFYDKFSPDDAPIPSSSSTPTPTVTPTNTPTPSSTPNPSASATPTNTPTPTPTPSAFGGPDYFYTYDIFMPSGQFTYNSPGVSVTGGLINIDWGDGNVSLNQSILLTGSISHTYTSDNQSYRIKIYPPAGQTILRIYHGSVTLNGADRVTDLINWGDNVCNFTNAANGLSQHFEGCSNLTGMLNTLPNLTGDTAALGMFTFCSNFNSPNVTSWNTSNINDFNLMFSECSSFNQNINGWDVSNASDLSSMFYRASSFNQSLNSWTFAVGVDLHDIFREASSFNGDITGWNIEFVNSITGMFWDATSFDQDISGWDITNQFQMYNMFDNCGLSTCNYDKIISGWEAQGPLTGVNLGANGLIYTLGGQVELDRNSLISTYLWSITGDTGSYSPSPCPTLTPSNTPTNTVTPTPSNTPNISQTPTPTGTPTPTPSSGAIQRFTFTVDTNNGTSPTMVTPRVYEYTGFATTDPTDYQYTIYWGDGNSNTVYYATASSFVSDTTHTYSSHGVYTVEIEVPSGQSFHYIRFDSSTADLKDKITAVTSWGNQFRVAGWGRLVRTFANCVNLVSIPGNLDTSGIGITNPLALYLPFTGADSFTGDTTSWNFSGATSLSFQGLFRNAPSFNQNIGGWDTSSVYNMTDTFYDATSFNQNLSSWDTSSVTDMNYTFRDATAFDQSLASWDISSLAGTGMVEMLYNCGMSTANYDATLIGWEGQASTPSNITLGANGLTYTLGGAAEAARTSLISTYGWTINGDSGV